MKRFHVTGVCIPDRHYMVDLAERVNTIIDDYIDQGAYFTINRARQYGKTTMINALERSLRGGYVVISISLESADDYFASMKVFVNGLAMDIAEEQLAEYLDAYGADRGYLLSFNFNKNKKTGIQEILCDGKHILEVTV